MSLIQIVPGASLADAALRQIPIDRAFNAGSLTLIDYADPTCWDGSTADTDNAPVDSIANAGLAASHFRLKGTSTIAYNATHRGMGPYALDTPTSDTFATLTAPVSAAGQIYNEGAMRDYVAIAWLVFLSEPPTILPGERPHIVKWGRDVENFAADSEFAFRVVSTGKLQAVFRTGAIDQITDEAMPLNTPFRVAAGRYDGNAVMDVQVLGGPNYRYSAPAPAVGSVELRDTYSLQVGANVPDPDSERFTDFVNTRTHWMDLSLAGLTFDEALERELAQYRVR